MLGRCGGYGAGEFTGWGEGLRVLGVAGNVLVLRIGERWVGLEMGGDDDGGGCNCI